MDDSAPWQKFFKYSTYTYCKICMCVYVALFLISILLLRKADPSELEFYRPRLPVYLRTLYNNTSTTSPRNKSAYKVPNLVHYIWYNDKTVEFRFDKALSVLAAAKYLQPDVIYFHTNREPKGIHYLMCKELPNFKVIHREPPKAVLKKIYHETDYSNYDRLKILKEYGGIYLDLDVFPISFDKVRQYPCTLGYEMSKKICGGIIICQKNHPFLDKWLEAYHNDFRKQWSYNSGIVPTKLIEQHPGIIHTEKRKLHRPNTMQLNQIYGSVKIDWRDKYAIHTWIRRGMQKTYLTGFPTPESIRTMNSTYGEIARDVFYNSSEIIKNSLE